MADDAATNSFLFRKSRTMSALDLPGRLGYRLWLWWRGRDYRLLLGGLPALTLGLAAALLSLIAYMIPQTELDARYVVRAQDSFKEHDYPTALICYDRLAARAEARPEILFGLAQTAQALGRLDQTLALMRHLAPLDRVGFGEAHLWWAQQIMTRPQLSEQDRRLAEQHLLRALEGSLPDRGLAAHGLLGELYLAGGKLDLAESHLTKVVQQRPHVHLRLALLYNRRGQKDRARSEAERAITYFRPRALADRTHHFARLAWADGTTFLEDFPQAVAILTDGLTTTRDSIYREALGRVYLAWHDSLASDPKSDAGQRLSLLEKGLENDPKNPDLLNRLLDATRLSSGESERARTLLQELLARGEGSAAIHFALGVDAWQRGQKEQSQLHMERAFQIAPHLPVVANNLAWTLAHRPQPDLPRALGLINAAVAQAPTNRNFRDTRGRILARLGQWKEALPDLEESLAGNKNDPELHRLLADTYDHLGSKEMADRHRKLAPPAPPNPAADPTR